MGLKKSIRGRPLKGSSRRLRCSFTLEQDSLSFIDKKASKLGVSRSDYLNTLLCSNPELENLLPKNYPSDFISKLFVKPFFSELDKICKKYFIKKLSLFGSVLGENFSENSDIDLLVEFDEVPSLFELARIARELKVVFNDRGVDLKTKKDLSKSIRKKVAKESFKIYGQ